VAFYVTAIIMTTNRQELAFTLRWILIGLSVNAVVAIVQGIALLGLPSVYEALDHFVQLHCGQQPCKRGCSRIYTGALVVGESADCPWVIDRSCAKFRSSGTRRWRIRAGDRSLLVQPSWLIFALFMAALAMSFSRLGLVVSVVLADSGCFRLIKTKSAKDFLVSAVILPSVVLVTVMVSLLSPYVRETFDLLGRSPLSVLDYSFSKEVGAGGREAFWMSSWNTFSESPVTGVGLGQSPFYFQKRSLWAYSEYEVQRYMRGDIINQGLPNAKHGLSGFV
jgi:hypothetical protein